MSNSLSSPTRQRSKRVPTLRTLAAQTEWLQGRILWQEGHVVWEHARGRLRPGAADLSDAQRCLNKSRPYTLTADQIFGDGEQWLETRREHLEWAKRLRTLVAPDLAVLASSSRARNPAVIGRLAELLIAEALCLNELPLRPSSVLLSRPALAPPALRKIVQDASAPPSGRALAAMTLGALRRAQDIGAHFAPNVVIPTTSAHNAWLRRAYEWGWRLGLPAQPALTVAFLAESNGVKLAQSCEQGLNSFKLVQFSPQIVRELLAAGVPAQRVLEVVQAARPFELMAERVMQFYRALWDQPLPRQNRGKAHRKKMAQQHLAWQAEPQRLDPIQQGQLAQSREETLALLSSLLSRSIQSSRDPQLIRQVGATVDFFTRPLCEAVPDLWSYLLRDGIEEGLVALWEAAFSSLNSGLELPTELQKPYFDILETCRSARWDTTQIFVAPSPDSQNLNVVDQLRNWQKAVWYGDIKPLRKLLARCEDASVAEDALELGVQGVLAQQHWHDREMYRWHISLARLFVSEAESWKSWELCNALDRFTSAREARAVLGPVVDALRGAPVKVREQLFFDLLDTLGRSRQTMRTAWPRLAPYIPLLRHFASKTQESERCAYAIKAAVQLDQVLRRQLPLSSSDSSQDDDDTPSIADEDDAPFAAQSTAEGQSITLALQTPAKALQAPANALQSTAGEPLVLEEQGKTWLQWLLAFLLEAETRKKNRVNYYDLGTMTYLATMLAAGDFHRFQAIFRTAACCEFEQSSTHLEKGLHATRLYRDLCLALADLFPRQPQRCLTLLVRLGLVARLGSEVLTPLETLQEDAVVDLSDAAESAGWQELLDALPELAPLADSYRRARQLLGQSDEMPAGVQRALQEREKLAGELHNLEAKLQEQPDRHDWAARVVSLRGQIADEARLGRLLREQGRERLGQATAEAHLALGEQQVLACYQARLAMVAGVLPTGIAFDIHWFNATLLTTDIDHNRQLLRRLLRYRIWGAKQWREEHPANALFLRALTYRGVEVNTWLSARPRAYRCPLAARERVRLHLERDPLHILQMGNYFDTCLSFGQCNSFSTVANACDLNKRVIYATDGAGRVVGRKLIGISSDGALIGFRTYTSLTDEKANNALRAIFRHYIQDFAAACRLPLADSGTIAVLLADEWYDDGVVSWEEAENGEAEVVKSTH